MKKIINVETGEELNFTQENLPIMVHAKEHSGGSLLSITIAAQLHSIGKKLLIFSAYPMAREEFLNQIEDKKDVLYFTGNSDIRGALNFQTIFIEHGNETLLKKFIENGGDLSDRVVFIKNIETINSDISYILFTSDYIIAGDFETNPKQRSFQGQDYNTKILFNSLETDILPKLERYQALMKVGTKEKLITVKDL